MTYINAAAPIAAHAAVTTNIHGVLGSLSLVPVYEISNDLLHSHDAEANTTSDTYVKLKTITLSELNPSPVTLRIKFDLKSDNYSLRVGGQIYKNGVGYGTEQETAHDYYDTFSQDLSFEKGDTLELWGKDYSSGDPTCYVQNLRIYGIKRVVPAESFDGVNT